MTGIGAVACAMLAIGGLVLVLAALAGVIPERPQRMQALSTGRWTTFVDNLGRTARGTWIRLAVGLVLGVVGMFALQWPVLLIVVPAAVVGLPHLLSEPPQQTIGLLEALDRWVRGMLAQMSTGKSITDAIRLSARQPPPLLAAPLTLLVKRLDDRWTAPQALQAMADELNSADSDAVLASLMLSAQRGGTGASVTLYALADTIQERLRALREIEAERSKPRVVVRQVTIISGITLVGFMILSPGFFTPYGTPVGQVILLILLALYVASIWIMRRMTLTRPRQRILRSVT